MITMESRTEGIKFERHKEESLISSQFFEEPKEEQSLTFSNFLFNKIFPITMSACYLYVMKKLTKYQNPK